MEQEEYSEFIYSIIERETAWNNKNIWNIENIWNIHKKRKE